jgi:hypothetical protein
MDGWDRDKRLRIEAAFYDFLNHCYIYSRDAGLTCLGEHLYDGQRRFITETFDALERDIHDIFCLKSRQLGISTIVRALIIFLGGIFDGVKGAVVFDTEPNKQEARSEITTMISQFPNEYKFPQVTDNNRSVVTLSNVSKFMFMSGGVRKTKSSGTLGRSVGLSLAAMSELCSIDNEEGLEALQNSFSDNNPNRLYIRESTARGYNQWHDMWTEARKDTTHCHCIFLGWWSKPSQRIDRSHRDFERYGTQPPTLRELERIKQVRDRYNHNITPEQLAWIRRKMDPGAEQEGDAEAEYEGSVGRLQEQPWTEDDAFQMTGSVFFAPEVLNTQVNKYVSKKFETFQFVTGVEFTDMKVLKARHAKSIELKIWDDPVPNGVYVVAADVAYGSSDKNDRSACSVFRCYADGMDQVAEYAWGLVGTRQYAWVIMALAAWYSGEGGEVYLIIELNGPGRAVWDEISHLRQHIARGYQPKEVAERGLENVFRNVKNYLYHRSDSLAGGHSYQWQTNPGAGPSGKVRLMERLRDFISNEKVHVRSMETLLEMKSVTRKEDVIEAQGRKKDDRVTALALGVRCFEDRVQRKLSTALRTRETETARASLTLRDKAALYSQYQFENFLGIKRKQRIANQRRAREFARRGY